MLNYRQVVTCHSTSAPQASSLLLIPFITNILKYSLILAILLPQTTPLPTPLTSHIQSNSTTIASSPDLSKNTTYSISLISPISNPKLILCINQLQIQSLVSFVSKFSVLGENVTETGFGLKLFNAFTRIYVGGIRYVVYEGGFFGELLGLQSVSYSLATNLYDPQIQQSLSIQLPQPYSPPTHIRSPSPPKIRCLNFLLGYKITTYNSLHHFTLTSTCSPVSILDTSITLNLEISLETINDEIVGNVVLLQIVEEEWFGYFYDGIVVVEELVRRGEESEEYSVGYLVENGIQLVLDGVWLYGLTGIEVGSSTDLFKFDGDWHTYTYKFAISINSSQTNSSEFPQNSASFFYFSWISCTDNLHYNKATNQCEQLICSPNQTQQLSNINLIDSITISNVEFVSEGMFCDGGIVVVYDLEGDVCSLGVYGDQVLYLGDAIQIQGNITDIGNHSSQTILQLGDGYILIGDTLYSLQQQNKTLTYTPITTLPPLNSSNNYIHGTLNHQPHLSHPSQANNSQKLHLLLLTDTVNLHYYFLDSKDNGKQMVFLEYGGIYGDLVDSDGDGDVNVTEIGEIVMRRGLVSIGFRYIGQDRVIVQIIVGLYILTYSIQGENCILIYYQQLPLPPPKLLTTNNPNPTYIPHLQQTPTHISKNCHKNQYILNRISYLYILTTDNQLHIYRSIVPNFLLQMNQLQSSSSSSSSTSTISINLSYQYQLIQEQFYLPVGNIMFRGMVEFVWKDRVVMEVSGDGSVFVVGCDSNLVYVFSNIQDQQTCNLQQQSDNQYCIGTTINPNPILSTYLPQTLQQQSPSNSSSQQYKLIDLIDLGEQDGAVISAIQIQSQTNEIVVMLQIQNIGNQKFMKKIGCYSSMPDSRVSCLQYSSQIIVKQEQILGNSTQSNNTINNMSQQQTTPQQNNIQNNKSNNTTPKQINTLTQQQQQKQLSTTSIIIISCTGGFGLVAAMISVYNICIKKPANKVKVNPREITRASIYNKQIYETPPSLVQFDTSQTIQQTSIDVQQSQQRGLIKEKSRKIMIIEDIE